MLLVFVFLFFVYRPVTKCEPTFSGLPIALVNFLFGTDSQLESYFIVHVSCTSVLVA